MPSRLLFVASWLDRGKRPLPYLHLSPLPLKQGVVSRFGRVKKSQELSPTALKMTLAHVAKRSGQRPFLPKPHTRSTESQKCVWLAFVVAQPLLAKNN